MFRYTFNPLAPKETNPADLWEENAPIINLKTLREPERVFRFTLFLEFGEVSQSVKEVSVRLIEITVCLLQHLRGYIPDPIVLFPELGNLGILFV